jgi:hypothetical protein
MRLVLLKYARIKGGKSRIPFRADFCPKSTQIQKILEHLVAKSPVNRSAELASICCKM